MMRELMQTRGKLVGLYGGSFDPLHNAHLHLAFELMEHHGLDEVWFIPAQISPFKVDSVAVSASHRLKMVELALEGISEFRPLDIECRRPGVSYTVDTVEEILRAEAEYGDPAHPNRYHLLLGDDSVASLAKWHRIDELVELIPLLIGVREGASASDCKEASPALLEAVSKGLTDTSRWSISATQVRQRLRERSYCGHLVPPKVLDYIYQNQLYYYL